MWCDKHRNFSDWPLTIFDKSERNQSESDGYKLSNLFASNRSLIERDSQ